MPRPKTIALPSENPDALENPPAQKQLSKITREGEAITLSELTQVATLFRETTQTQSALLKGTGDNLRETLKAVEVTQQTMEELLNLFTTGLETLQAQTDKLVTVAVALTRATTALRAIPTGSPKL